MSNSDLFIWDKVEHDNGDIITYLNDQVHSWSENEPAIVTKLGTLIFFKHGKLHRDCGPAYFGQNNVVEYWLEGKQYTYDEWDFITNHSDHYP